MDRRTKVKVIGGITLLVSWLLLISGIIKTPPFIWFLLIIITFIFYIGSTSHSSKSRKSPEELIEDMEDYIERKAEERLGESENGDSQKKKDREDEYDLGDDIEIIKK